MCVAAYAFTRCHLLLGRGCFVGLAGSGFNSRSRCMCDPALRCSLRPVCYHRVGSRVLTHACTLLAPERLIDIIVSLTSPKLVRLNLCERRLFTPEISYDYRATDSHGKNHYYSI